MANWMGWAQDSAVSMSNEAEIRARTAQLTITAEILALIAELDEFKGAWQAIGKLAPERLASLKRVATIESVGSSTRIEGSKLSDGEVEALLSRIEIRTFSTRDEQEVAGYAEVMDTLFENYAAIEPTENHIRQLHRDLLQYSEKDARHRGSYKTLPNHVEAFGPSGESLGVVFETATPFETASRMSALVDWLINPAAKAELHPLLTIAAFAVMFLAIHPFQDGNGRLSRALTTFLLLRAGYAYVPYSSLESAIEQHKDAYYLNLRKTQGTLATENPNWEPWTVYFLRALKQQKDQLAAKVETERTKLGVLPQLSLTILELVHAYGRISIADVVAKTGTSRNTIKDHVAALVVSGHLVRHGAGRGTWYSAI